MTDAPASPAPPAYADDGRRYRLDGRIATGGMGEVWRARDTVLGREVALKVLPARLAGDPVVVERFRREARAAFELRDPHVVPVHGFGEVDGRLYLSMRLVDGEDLARLLARRAPLEPHRAARIALVMRSSEPGSSQTSLSRKRTSGASARPSR